MMKFELDDIKWMTEELEDAPIGTFLITEVNVFRKCVYSWEEHWEILNPFVASSAELASLYYSHEWSLS